MTTCDDGTEDDGTDEDTKLKSDRCHLLQKLEKEFVLSVVLIHPK